MKAPTHITLFVLLLIISLISTASLATANIAEQIYTSKELTIQQRTASQLHIPSGINQATVELSYIPSNDYRQTILEQTYHPNNVDKTQSTYTFKWNNPNTGTHPFYIDAKIKTKNAYVPITKQIQFPINPNTIPQEYQKYLQTSKNIDINDDIIRQANILASGKTDLYDVAHTIATWVERNIEYDLSTLTAEISQSASWTLRERVGVCDELTSLYIALMRSLGIPTRFISGVAYTNSPLFDNPWGAHAWAEVYFPEFGWVPFDLTYRQFGHIDASHIKLKTDVDADQSFTRFSWTGTGSQVSMDPLTLDVEILEFHERLEPFITISAQTAFTNVGIQSDNLLQITVENVKDYYVSSTLQISSPQEVDIEKYVTVLLEPRQTKTIHIPMKTSSLDPQFRYTIPIEVSTIYGAQATTTFTIARQYPSYTSTDVTAKIPIEETQTQSQVSTSCNPEPAALAGGEFLLFCVIANQGNIFYDNVRFCLDKTCQDTNLGIQQSKTIQQKFTFDEPGTYETQLAMYIDGVVGFQKTVPIIVESAPQLLINFSGPSTIQYTQTVPIDISLQPITNALAYDVHAQVFAGIDPIKYYIPVIDKTILLDAHIIGKELKEGQNDISLHITFSDEIGRQYTQEQTIQITLQPLTVTQKIGSTIRRFLRSIFR